MWLLENPIDIAIAKDDVTIRTEYSGNVKIISNVFGKQIECVVRNVLYVPDLHCNLFSVMRVDAAGMKVVYGHATRSRKSTKGTSRRFVKKCEYFKLVEKYTFLNPRSTTDLVTLPHFQQLCVSTPSSRSLNSSFRLSWTPSFLWPLDHNISEKNTYGDSFAHTRTLIPLRRRHNISV